MSHDQVKALLPFLISLIGLFLFLSIYFCFFAPPTNFSIGTRIVIEEGKSAREIAENLKNNDFIRSPFVFIALTKFYGQNGLLAGGYAFDTPQNVYGIVKALKSTDPKNRSVRITFFEGMTISEMAEICEKTLPLCIFSEFVEIAKSKEGYLFPDTYFFNASSDASSVISVLIKTNEEKLLPYEERIKNSGHSLEEIVTMASLLEREAPTKESRQIIAGILWKRIEIGMPLQVDAAFNYVNGKNTYELTTEDLAEDSPYNTYKNKGLPPGPIANPSLESIEAALEPIPTDYVFYLSSRDGTFHYAKTHDQHVENKRLYLR